jgi:hypothetical protein
MQETNPIDGIHLAFGVSPRSGFDALAIVDAEIVEEALTAKCSEDQSNGHADFSRRRADRLSARGEDFEMRPSAPSAPVRN